MDFHETAYHPTIMDYDHHEYYGDDASHHYSEDYYHPYEHHDDHQMRPFDYEHHSDHHYSNQANATKPKSKKGKKKSS